MGGRRQLTKLSASQRRLRMLARRLAWAGGIALLLLVLALADRAGFFGRPLRSDRYRYDGKAFQVVRVVDGDTLDIACPDRLRPTTRIRLLGVDTPETVKPDAPVQHFGPEATAYVRRQVLGKVVTIELPEPRTRDRYGRLTAYVILPDGRNLSELIVAEGYGYADPRFAHPLARRFQRAQRQAIKLRRGLWKEATAQDLPAYLREKVKLPARPGS